MKILSIGNSFSNDAHGWLQKLAQANGDCLETANLFIGGCSLETHWQNVTENNEAYDYEINGGQASRKISIIDALRADNWDIITLQQVSQFSGMIETYEPYLSALADLVRKEKPDAKLYFHQTWAYEIDTTHEGFKNYDNDQRYMYDCIERASKQAAKKINAEIIPVGREIQYIRENIKEFDYKNGGLSLCRDGFHLTFDYGRFAAAAVWLRTLTGKSVNVTEFQNFNPEILKKIIRAVNEL